MNKNIVIIHYNTPHLTECLVRSINMFVDDAVIYIFDNSDREPFTATFDNVTIINNTSGDVINFDEWLENYPTRFETSAFKNNYASAKHCYSVQKCMEILNEPFILLDSDVLLKKDISDLFDENYVFIGNFEYWKAAKTVGGHKAVRKPRAIPYLCFINTDICSDKNIQYFDEDFIYGLSTNGDSYDTGTYFFEQILTWILPWKKINLNDYIIHYKAGSWVESARKYDNYKKININEWLENNKRYWFDNDSITPSALNGKKVVYTCITGDYDKLLEPTYVNEDFDYICFTDNEYLTSNVWKIQPLPKETNGLSQIKKQRYVKINAHEVVREYDISIWVDGSILIRGDLNELLNTTLTEDASVFVPKHPVRTCIYKESQEVVRLKKDTNENVKPQMDRYKEEGFPSGYGLLQSNIMIRLHNNKGCIRLMKAWWNELKDNSHRDQLSFNYVLWKNSDVSVIYMDKDIFKSKWFFWNTRHKKTYTVSKPKTKEAMEELKRIFKETVGKKRNNKINTFNVSIY